MNKTQNVSRLYIVGQCNISTLALHHILTPHLSDIFCTSINQLSQLAQINSKFPLCIVMILNRQYADDMHEKLKFLCSARNKQWNIRVALVMMSHSGAPHFIHVLLQTLAIHYASFNSRGSLALLGQQLADFFMLEGGEVPPHILIEDKQLSAREYMVLLYLLQGASLPLISRTLNVRLKTTYCHRQNIMAKWELSGWRELILYRKTLLMIINCISTS